MLFQRSLRAGKIGGSRSFTRGGLRKYDAGVTFCDTSESYFIKLLPDFYCHVPLHGLRPI